MGPAIREIRRSARIGVGSASSSVSSLVAVAIAGAPCLSKVTMKFPDPAGASADIAVPPDQVAPRSIPNGRTPGPPPERVVRQVLATATPKRCPKNGSPGAADAVLRGPLLQFGDSLVVLQRAAVEAKFLEVLPGLADVRTRLQPQQLHDLLAVEVRPDVVEVFLLLQPADTCFEIIVGRLEGGRPALVPGRAVGTDELVQPGQQVTGVGDVP